MVDLWLYVAIPYVAVAVAVAGGVYRYFADRFSYSSQSSQFLENRALFWGSTAWHYGIVLVLLAHFAALAASDAWGDLVSEPTRLYTLEAIGLSLGFLAFFGLVVLVLRRLASPRLMRVTTPMDWALLLLLLAQTGLGLWIAVAYRWGSDWYVHTAVPWLESLAKFQPETATIAILPVEVKVHALGGFLLLALFPFTRLVHVVTVPVTYLWRPLQVVVWNRRPARAAAGARTIRGETPAPPRPVARASGR